MSDTNEDKKWWMGWGWGDGHKTFPCTKYAFIYYSYYDITIFVLYFPASWIRLSEKYAFKSKSLVIMMMRLASYLSAPLLEILHDKTSLPQLISSATHLKDTSLIITKMFLTWEALKCKTGGSTTIWSLKSELQIVCFHLRLYWTCWLKSTRRCCLFWPFFFR